MTPSDRILTAGGVVAAALSITFAGYMVKNDAHAPYVVGVKYLSLFAQPNRSVASRANALPHATQEARLVAPVRVGPAAAPPDLDFTPTGAIGGALGKGDAPRAIPRLIAVDEAHAWLQVGETYSELKPGDDIPHLGRISAIEKVDGVWALRMNDGALIRSNDDQGRFDRPFIFGP